MSPKYVAKYIVSPLIGTFKRVYVWGMKNIPFGPASSSLADTKGW